MSMVRRYLILILVLVAVAVRLGFFLYGLDKLPLSSDEAWPGLMATHILKGEFPVVYWGQSYMGTQESYIDAVLIKLLGGSTWVLRLYPLTFAFLFLFFTYKLACRIYNRDVGLICLALLAIPVPYLTMCGVAIPPDNYLATTTLGTLSLYILHRIVFGGSQRTRDFILLGAVLGYTFWLHLLIVSYIGVAVLFIFLRDKLCLLRKQLWAGLITFAVTASPLLLYAGRHQWSTFHDVARQTCMAKTLENFEFMMKFTLQFLLGARVMFYGDNSNTADLPDALFYPLLCLSAVLILLVIIKRWPNLWRLCYLSLRNVDGTAILLALAGAAIVTFCRSSRSGAHDVRYLLPIVSALPILFAAGLWHIYQWRKGVAVTLLIFIMTACAWGNTILLRVWNDPVMVGVNLELPDTKPLYTFLDSQGIRHIFTHYWLSYRINMETQERILCTERFNERFPGREVRYQDQVAAAGGHVAFVCHPTLGIKAGDFEQILKTIGGTWKKKEITCFTVYYDFCAPTDESKLVEIPRAAWTLTGTHRPELLPLTVDNKTTTKWTSAVGQAPGMQIHIDLGAVYTVAKLRFDLGDALTEHPRESAVEVSLDGRQWTRVFHYGRITDGAFWDNNQPRFLVRGNYYTSAFYATPARYIRINQLGTEPAEPWAIAELRIFALPAAQ